MSATTIRDGLIKLWRDHAQDPRAQPCCPPTGMIDFVGGEWETGEGWCGSLATVYLTSECYERPVDGRRGGGTGSWYLCEDCCILVAMWLEDVYAGGEVKLERYPWPLPELLNG